AGHVSVTLKVGDSLYRVERHLKQKGGEVVHDACYFSDKEGRTRISPSDLKEKMVSLLGFNEPTHPKAESLVYRYAVFTPQERMKDILTQNAEERLHVIRRVLGAQTYQAAAENSSILEKRINRQAYGKKKSSEDLADKQRDLSMKTQKLADLQRQIPALEEEAARTEQEVKSAESRWTELQDERRHLTEVAGRIPLLRRDVEELEAETSDDALQITRLQKRIEDEILPRIKAFALVETPRKPMKSLKETRASQQDALSQLRASRISAAADLSKANELISKGVCPYCGQLVSEDVSKRSAHLESEVARLDTETDSLSQQMAATDSDLTVAEEWEVAKADADRAAAEKKETEASVERLRTHQGDAMKRHSRAKAELAEAEEKAAEAKGVSARIDAIRQELDSKRASNREASDRLTRANAEKDDLVSRVSELEDEVRLKEAAAAESRKLTAHQEWVSDFFRPTVEEIERQTLAHAAASFNGHFQRFFASLVEDPDIFVRVREDFSPVFEREGFEQEYDALSGGERTSVALAYRFALNSVIGEDFSSTPELVILDEPTDGFSKEQIFKLRGLLAELHSRQVIIVSHERELESMADHIFRVEKSNGTSRVSEV
ncbi:MAG TPA: hypothetical protein VFE91_07805, partial [Nitrososphaerales archaeon]|nr:hypothetical protein [Nitrososphaerales archaeon]